MTKQFLLLSLFLPLSSLMAMNWGDFAARDAALAKLSKDVADIVARNPKAGAAVVGVASAAYGSYKAAEFAGFVDPMTWGKALAIGYGAGRMAMDLKNSISSTLTNINHQNQQMNIAREQADSQLSENDFEHIQPHGYDLQAASRPPLAVSPSRTAQTISAPLQDKMDMLDQLRKNNELALAVHSKILGNSNE